MSSYQRQLSRARKKTSRFILNKFSWWAPRSHNFRFKSRMPRGLKAMNQDPPSRSIRTQDLTIVFSISERPRIKRFSALRPVSVNFSEIFSTARFVTFPILYPLYLKIFIFFANSFFSKMLLFFCHFFCYLFFYAIPLIFKNVFFLRFHLFQKFQLFSFVITFFHSLWKFLFNFVFCKFQLFIYIF